MSSEKKKRSPGAGRKKLVNKIMISIRIEEPLNEEFTKMCQSLGVEKTSLISEYMRKALKSFKKKQEKGGSDAPEPNSDL